MGRNGGKGRRRGARAQAQQQPSAGPQQPVGKGGGSQGAAQREPFWLSNGGAQRARSFPLELAVPGRADEYDFNVRASIDFDPEDARHQTKLQDRSFRFPYPAPKTPAMLTLDELAEVMERLQGTQTQNGDLGVYGTEKKFLQLQNVYQAMLHLNGKGPSRETENIRTKNTAQLKPEAWQKLEQLYTLQGTVRDYGNVPAPLFDFFRIDPLGNIVDKDALKGSLAACSTDHIFPHSRGGLSKKENLVCLAEAANTDKSDNLWMFLVAWRAPGRAAAAPIAFDAQESGQVLGNFIVRVAGRKPSLKRIVMGVTVRQLWVLWRHVVKLLQSPPKTQPVTQPIGQELASALLQAAPPRQPPLSGGGGLDPKWETSQAVHEARNIMKGLLSMPWPRLLEQQSTFLIVHPHIYVKQKKPAWGDHLARLQAGGVLAPDGGLAAGEVTYLTHEFVRMVRLIAAAEPWIRDLVGAWSVPGPEAWAQRQLGAAAGGGPGSAALEVVDEGDQTAGENEGSDDEGKSGEDDGEDGESGADADAPSGLLAQLDELLLLRRQEDDTLSAGAPGPEGAASIVAQLQQLQKALRDSDASSAWQQQEAEGSPVLDLLTRALEALSLGGQGLDRGRAGAGGWMAAGQQGGSNGRLEPPPPETPPQRAALSTINPLGQQRQRQRMGPDPALLPSVVLLPPLPAGTIITAQAQPAGPAFSVVPGVDGSTYAAPPPAPVPAPQPQYDSVASPIVDRFSRGLAPDLATGRPEQAPAPAAPGIGGGRAADQQARPPVRVPPPQPPGPLPVELTPSAAWAADPPAPQGCWAGLRGLLQGRRRRSVWPQRA